MWHAGRTSFGVALALSLLAASCQKASDADTGKRVPKPPPSASAQVPASLHIEVEVDGKTAPAIDAARVTALKPDFTSEDRRAWKLSALLGAPAEREGAVVAVTGEKGLTVLLPRAKVASDPVGVLVITKRGETTAALVSPSEPFPAYHGQGGRLHRPGDPTRIAGVTKFRVYVEGAAPSSSAEAGAASVATVAPPVEVHVTGRAASTWTADAMHKVKHYAAPSSPDDRDAWSLRDLAASLVGPKARVVAVSGDGERVEIKKAEWTDAKRIPILRVGGGGTRIKLRWVDAAGKMGDAVVKNVQRIDVEP
jgi:hypothetical protein